MKKILVIVMGDYKLDPRVYKHAVTIKKNGFDVEVVSFDSTAKTDHIEDVGGIPVYYYNSDVQKLFNRCGELLMRYKLYKMVSYVYHLLFYTTDMTSPSYASIDFSKQNIIDRTFKQKPRNLNNKLMSLKEYFYCYVLMNFYLYYKLRKIKADLYLVNDLPMLLTGLLLSKGNSKPVIYDSHELWVDGSALMPKLYKRLMTYHEKCLIPFVSRVVTVNNHIADTLFERYRIEHPLVVFNCPMYSPPLEKNKSFNNSVIYQGRFYITRGLEQAIESSKYIDCNMYFRGFDYYNDTYTTTLKEMVVTDNVFFIPPVDMPKLVSSLEGFDIGMVPYRPTVLNNIYSSPNKLFEYMMAGMAVIGSDLPVIGGVIKSSGCGDVFNPDDPKNIADVINSIMHNPERLSMMKESSCKAAKECWNWEIQSKPLIEEYKRLMEC